ncbi:MAG: hypothetical protein UW40_C0019G0012 [Parcubacteria group bacterium GW2011_GWF2_44_17]|nr:MAG: hypothetical protein UW40_C0019G0012 [Parcubacteria group bacterium GW2011_GWF2_44_17]
MSTKKKILIIEDEKPMARALELKLTHSGFEAKAVFNGADGVKILEKNAGDGRIYCTGNAQRKKNKNACHSFDQLKPGR